MMQANAIFARGPRLPKDRQRTLKSGGPVVIGNTTVSEQRNQGRWGDPI